VDSQIETWAQSDITIHSFAQKSNICQLFTSAASCNIYKYSFLFQHTNVKLR